jgi:hypothetical protein
MSLLRSWSLFCTRSYKDQAPTEWDPVHANLRGTSTVPKGFIGGRFGVLRRCESLTVLFRGQTIQIAVFASDRKLVGP